MAPSVSGGTNFNDKTIEEFRANEGRVSGLLADTPMIGMPPAQGADQGLLPRPGIREGNRASDETPKANCQRAKSETPSETSEIRIATTAKAVATKCLALSARNWDTTDASRGNWMAWLSVPARRAKK